MKKTKFIFLLTLLPLFNSAQVFSWAKSGTCTAGGNAEGMAVATDASANAYIVGYYGGSTLTFGTNTLTNTGGNDMYIAKYDSNGNIQWAKSEGGVNVDIANAVATDASGNVFVTGNFMSPTMVIGTNTLVNPTGTDDIFLTKYDTNGNVLWAVCAGDTGTERSNGVSTDASGNVYITGNFSSGTLAIGGTTLTNTSGNYEVFIAKYNASGIPQWALSAGGIGGGSFGVGITTDNSGNTYVTGEFSSSTINFGTYTLTSAGSGSAFLGKFDTNGNPLWAKSSTGSSNAAGFSVATDPAGSVYVTGDFDGPKIILGTYTVTNSWGTTTSFLAKFDASGNTIWMNGVGGGGAHVGYSVDTYTGGVYVVGGVGGAFSSVFGTYTLTAPPGSVDPMFIGKYDLNGNYLCADILPSGGDDQISVSVDQFGNAYISGDFAINSFVLGSNTLTLSAAVSEEIFVTKYSCTSAVGIEVLQKEDGSIIYPNPNNGIFDLITSIDSSKDIYVYDTNGKIVYEKKSIVENKIAIDLHSLAEGIYIVRITNGSTSLTKKLIKQN